MNTLSIKESLSYGWQKMKENLWFFVGVTLAGFIPSALIEGIDRSDIFGPFGFLFSIAINVIGSIMMIGTIKIYLKINSGEVASFRDLFDHYRLFWKFLGAHVLYFLIVFAGFILLIIPGLVFLFRYMFVLTLVVDKDMGPVAALKESAKMTYGHKWRLVGFSFVILGVNLLGLICLGVGILVTIPVSSMAMIFVYKKLLNTQDLTPKQISI